MPVTKAPLVIFGSMLAAHATFYLPHIIFLFYKVGQSLFSPATKLFLYESVCYELFEGEALQSAPHDANNRTNLTEVLLEVKHNLTATVHCQNMTGQAENAIQGAAADYIMAMKILQDIPAFFVGLFCGGWSDRVGRRLPMMFSCIGGISVAILFSVLQITETVTMPIVFVGLAVNAVSGRNTLITTAVQAIVADQTAGKLSERTRQLGFILGMNFFGLFTGSLIMALMADELPFWSMFVCVAGVYFLALILIVFALSERKPSSTQQMVTSEQPDRKRSPSSNSQSSIDNETASTRSASSSSEKSTSSSSESISVAEKRSPSPTTATPTKMDLQLEPTKNNTGYDMSLGNKLRSMCLLANFTDTLRTITRRRPNYRRRCLLLSYLSIALINMCKSGEVDVLLLFVKHSPLNWSKSGYGYLLSFQYAAVGLYLVLLLPVLINRLKLSDTLIIIVCSLAKVGGLLLLAFSDQTWMVFLAMIFTSTFGMTISCLRSTVSKMVDDDENGRAFAVISSSETVSDLVGVVFFIRLYHWGLSLDTMGRSLPFIVIAAVNLVVLGLAFLIRHEMKQVHLSSPDPSSAEAGKKEDGPSEKGRSEPESTAAAVVIVNASTP